MNIPIAIDATDAQQCAVPADRFRLVKSETGNGTPFEEVVHTAAPYLHFQVLRPDSEEQRNNAIAFFKQNHRIHVAYTDRPDILLLVGCTKGLDIRSEPADCPPEDLRNLIGQAGHWFRFYGSAQ